MGNEWKCIYDIKLIEVGMGRGNGQTLGPGLEFCQVSSRGVRFTEGTVNWGRSCQGALISRAESQEASWTVNVNVANFASLPQTPGDPLTLDLTSLTSDPWRSFDIGPHFLGFFRPPRRLLFPIWGRGSLEFLHPSLTSCMS